MHLSHLMDNSRECDLTDVSDEVDDNMEVIRRDLRQKDSVIIRQLQMTKKKFGERYQYVLHTPQPCNTLSAIKPVSSKTSEQESSDQEILVVRRPIAKK